MADLRTSRKSTARPSGGGRTRRLRCHAPRKARTRRPRADFNPNTLSALFREIATSTCRARARRSPRRPPARAATGRHRLDRRHEVGLTRSRRHPPSVAHNERRTKGTTHGNDRPHLPRSPAAGSRSTGRSARSNRSSPTTSAARTSTSSTCPASKSHPAAARSGRSRHSRASRARTPSTASSSRSS